MSTTLKRTDAGVLDVAYLEAGAENDTAVLLLHGFPYDVHAYDEVTPLLVLAGCRVITPYLRGFGPTRFLSADTVRSGQQGALAHDLIGFMDALKIQSAVLAGYDWGGRAACIVSALWPERSQGLVSVWGYNVQDIPGSRNPVTPEDERRLWYQYYFHSERGRTGLARYRYDLCKLLWRLWSPTWDFDDDTFDRTAVAFDNPDFVDVVIHSYRHRFGLVAGDPAVDDTEQLLTKLPKISVATIALDGDADGVAPLGGFPNHDRCFSGRFERRVIPGVGHNPPQEAPQAFADAVLSVKKWGPGNNRR